MKASTILKGAPVHLTPPYSYSYSFQSLEWHRRLLNYLGSGKLLEDYEFQRRRGVPIYSPQIPNVNLALVKIENEIKKIASRTFDEAIGDCYRFLAYADNDDREGSVVMASLLRIALQHTFPGYTDLIQIRRWPLWKLVAYLPSDNSSCTVVFNEPTKEDAFNRIVQAYMESEGCRPDQAWMISDVASVDKNLTDSYTLICEFSRFAEPLIGDAFAIPVYAPDDAWTQDSQLEFVDTPSVQSTNSYRTYPIYIPDTLYSNQGSKGTTA